MKKILIAVSTLLFFSMASNAQTRCFRFYLNLSTEVTEWRDTSCIACTADPSVIADVEAQLALPKPQRNKIIAGNIAAGNAWINSNSNHSFKWHYVPGRWTLNDMAMEVCDGRPFADLDSDTTYWLHTVGSFCPWTSQVSAEVAPASVDPIIRGEAMLSILPNPVSDVLHIAAFKSVSGKAQLVNAEGRIVMDFNLALQRGERKSIDISSLASGMYYLQAMTSEGRIVSKILKM